MKRNEFSKLLSKGENDKVDFKQEWYSSNKRVDLVIDILNFVNTVHHDDCYIIIGVDDTEQTILGVEVEDPNRFNTEKLTDFIRNLPLANEYIPRVSVDSLNIGDKVVDIITIFNTTNTPVYFYKDYKKGKKSIGAGQILSRNQGTNTPIDRTAPAYMTEQLWRKKFKLDQNIETQYVELLKDYNNWSFSDTYNGTPMRFIYNLNPNFYIEFLEDDMDREQVSSISLLATRIDIRWQLVSLKYNHIEIRSFLINIMDGARFYQLVPETGFFRENSELYSYEYYYYDSLKYTLNEMLWNNTRFINHSYIYDKFEIEQGIVCYKNEKHRNIVESLFKKKYNFAEKISPSEEEISMVQAQIKTDLFEWNRHELSKVKYHLQNLKLSQLINVFMKENTQEINKLLEE